MQQDQPKSQQYGQFKCDRCGKAFSTEREQREHMEKEHKVQSQTASQDRGPQGQHSNR